MEDSQTYETVVNFWEEYSDEIISFGKAFVLTLVVILAAWLISSIVKRAIMKSVAKISAIDNSIGKAVHAVFRTVIWLLALLIILDLFGINTASILTILGAAGLAVGLAMKDSLSNIAAGLMLFILRPYKVGDYVDCGPVSGTIIEMGLFSTTLTTADGLFIAAPNSVLFGAPVKNYSRNPIRRIDITVGIAYSDDLTTAIAILKKMMADNELILKDPAPEVLVSELANSSVNLNLRFWAKSEEYWNAYWMVKGQLKATIENAGLNIPFPQRVVTLASPIPAAPKAE